MGRRGCRTGWLAAAARGLLVLVVVVVQHCAHRTDGLAAGDCASTYSGRRDFLKRAVTAASVAVATAGHVQSSPAVDSAGATALPAGAPQSTAVSEAFSGLVSGAAVSTAKIILLHPVDTVKVRLQTSTPSSRTGGKLFQGLFDGILPPLVTGAPSGALFFAAKDSLQSSLISILGPGNREIATLLAVGLAQFPYWGVRTPVEVIKSRRQAGVVQDENPVRAAKHVVENAGVKGLYVGYASNIAYAFPADAIKFLVYEFLKKRAKEQPGHSRLSALESALLGSGASLVAQVLTTPLDVVRTRIMTQRAEDPQYTGILDACKNITKEEGASALLSGTIPRALRSVLSGAIQFSTYEFTKQLFGIEIKK